MLVVTASSRPAFCVSSLSGIWRGLKADFISLHIRWCVTSIHRTWSLTLDYTKTITMIDRDKELTHDQKARNKASMDEVLKFCNNKTDCRRVQVLSFFNERFDPANCHQGCDTCLAKDKLSYTEEDVTADAKLALNLVAAFSSSDRITLKNAVECFRGTGRGANKGLENNPFYGQGKDWSKTEAERLFQQLFVENGLKEYAVQNRSGWSNSYIQVNSSDRQVHSGDADNSWGRKRGTFDPGDRRS